MAEQIEQIPYYEQIKANYSEALVILQELKEKNQKEDNNEARRSYNLFEKEM